MKMLLDFSFKFVWFAAECDYCETRSFCLIVIWRINVDACMHVCILPMWAHCFNAKIDLWREISDFEYPLLAVMLSSTVQCTFFYATIVFNDKSRFFPFLLWLMAICLF